MNEAPGGFRLDRMTGTWVAVVPLRRGAFSGKVRGGGLPEIRTRCPFCPGHESDTERTIARSPEDGQWAIRVVPNRYPLVTVNAESTPDDSHRPLVGHHEVVVESAAHVGDLADFSEAHLTDLLRVYRDRAKALVSGPQVSAVNIYRNRGRRAGASQPHPHGQIVTTNVVGPDLAVRAVQAKAFFDRQGATLLSDEIGRAQRSSRLVVEQLGIVALCPEAPHFNHQTWIAQTPDGETSSRAFWDLPDRALNPLASVLRRVSSKLRQVTGNRDYNLVFRNPPVEAAQQDWAFWYLDLMPRGGGGAGFELGTGIDCVVVPPETAARELRAAEAEV